MSDNSPIIMWFRRDLRLSDHPALTAACQSGRPVIPLFIHDAQSEALGAAPKFRLGLALGCLGETLAEKGSRLILRRGDALEVLREVIEATGAGAVYWSRLYDPAAIDRDAKVKEALKDDGAEACSFAGHLMFEPWTVETKTGAFYKVFTPYWKAVRGRDVATPLATPSDIPAPPNWPQSAALDDWQMDAEMQRGRDVVRPYVRLGGA
ncbi:deoxyribodipyrimidine photo-lyase, partial [Sulfitobacter sp. 15WGC]